MVIFLCCLYVIYRHLKGFVHLDMEETIALVKACFMFNVIMDSNGNISAAVAGDYIKAHEQGRKYVDTSDNVNIKVKALDFNQELLLNSFLCR